MKIIMVDNFNRENVSDTLIAENVSEYFGKKIVKYLNNTFSGDTSPDYFKLVTNDYKLFTFEP